MNMSISRVIPLTAKIILKSILYGGKNHFCSLCNTGLKEFRVIGRDSPIIKKFKIIGAGVRKAGCPVCGSRDRDRLLYHFLLNDFKLFEKPKNFKILHIAPELLISRAIRKHNFENYICGDLFTEGYKYPKYVLEMNVLDIPYEDNHFDLIICNHVLEHIPEDKEALLEINRVLKNNATAILQVPISETLSRTYEDDTIIEPHLRKKKFGQLDHVRIYGQDFFDKLISVGFKVDKKYLKENLVFYGINGKEPIIIGTKNID